MITERDLKIMCFIDDFGFSKIDSIDEIFFSHNKECSKEEKIDLSIVRKRLRGLEKMELLESTRDFNTREKIFYLTAKGRAYLKSYGFTVFRNTSALSEQVKINWINYRHDSYIIEVYKAFRRYGHDQMIPERSGRMQEIFSHNAPDLIILDEFGQFICIEVELSQKAQKRLQDKMSDMVSYENVGHILYLFGDTLIEQSLKKAISLAKIPSNKKEMIGLASLKSFIDDPKPYLKRIMK